MRMLRMLAAAGLVIVSLGTTTVASARDHNNDRHEQGVRGDRNGRHNWNGNDRDGRGDRYGSHRNGRDYRYGRHDNGNHYGWRNGRGHNRCHIEWRHHRQIRVCR